MKLLNSERDKFDRIGTHRAKRSLNKDHMREGRTLAAAYQVVEAKQLHYQNHGIT